MASRELKTVLEIIKSRMPETTPTIEEMRAGMEAQVGLIPLADDVRCQPLRIGSIPGEWVSTSESAEGRVVYYLHGGGYVMGSINTHREMASRIARAAQARVLLIDYRLAPEHPFPAAVEDAVVGYRWLLDSGLNPARMVVAGDSAGGGLTVAALVALKDRGLSLPAAGVCLSPWVDMEAGGQSMVSKAEIDPMVQREDIRAIAQAYVGRADPRDPLASPLYADLTGLPPLLIQVGTAEVLLDDARRLAKKAIDDGVWVALETWPDMIHVWQAYAVMLPEGRQAIDRIGAFVRGQTA